MNETRETIFKHDLDDGRLLTIKVESSFELVLRNVALNYKNGTLNFTNDNINFSIEERAIESFRYDGDYGIDIYIEIKDWSYGE